MADPYESSEDAARKGSASPPTTPRWVKVSAIVALVALLLLVALLVFGGGEHGPGRHSSAGDNATPPAAIDDRGGHTRPEGGH